MNKRLLLVFVHGFRGSETSFKQFPDWLKTTLQTIYPIKVESIVYPSYKTSGDLSVAVKNFSSWLLDQIKEENETNIIILAHSMGGIVGADTIIQFNERREHDNPLKKAEILGLVAFDTPFYSINHDSMSSTALTNIEKWTRAISPPSTPVPSNSRGVSNNQPQLTWLSGTPSLSTITSNTTTRSARSTSTTTTTSSSSSKKWGFFAGAAAAVAVGAAGIYINREKIASTFSNAYDQMEFVSTLIDFDGCDKRVKKLLEIPDLFVRCFYIMMPSVDEHIQPRTFIALPPDSTQHLFIPIITKAESEVAAHTSLFNPTKNNEYYNMGSDTISLISEMMARYNRKYNTTTTTTTSKPSQPIDLDLD